MNLTRKYLDTLSRNIIGCAIEVHKHIGPGLLESVYEKCFTHELGLKGLNYMAQKRVPVSYKGLRMEAELRYDVLVEDLIIVELKSMDGILPIHEAVMLTYLKMLSKPKGIIINFNSTNIFYTGQKTIVNEFYAALPEE
jgi:GxxExxY protein